MSYDVFISYRRKDGSDYARQIQLKLQNYGYNVFLDFDELKDSVFDKRIMNAISNSKVFIAILTPQYLSKASNPEDWVRKEIECAVEKGVHIVPINIDRQWQGFPSNCPEHIAKYIGQHQYSEIFTGSQFVTTMDDLNKHRLRPYIKVASMSQPAVGAVVRVRADMDCRIVKFGEDVGLVLAGKWATLRLKKGRHILDFVSTENPADHSEITYKVDDVDMDDFFEVVLKPIRQARIDKEAEERRKAEEEAEKQRKAEEAAERRRKAEERRRRREEKEAEERRRVEENAKSYKIGDIYDDGIKMGVVFEVTANGKHGKILSFPETYLRWATKDSANQRIGATSTSDGALNMLAVQAIEGWQEKYPAFAWCAELGEDWYLPAKEEIEVLQILEVRNAVKSALKRYGYPTFGNWFQLKSYWSSTESENTDYMAQFVVVVDIYGRGGYKGNSDYVRAVAKF